MMRRFALCAWLAVVLANASCTAPTQVILEIDAEEGLRAEISSVRLQMESTNEPFTAPEDRPFSPTHWPFTTVLAPLNRDATRRYRVEVTATTASGRIVARASSGFAPGRSWTLRLRFERSCLDVDCNEEESCRSGRCVLAEVPIEGSDAGAVEDAGMSSDSPTSISRTYVIDAFSIPNGANMGQAPGFNLDDLDSDGLGSDCVGSRLDLTFGANVGVDNEFVGSFHGILIAGGFNAQTSVDRHIARGALLLALRVNGIDSFVDDASVTLELLLVRQSDCAASPCPVMAGVQANQAWRQDSVALTPTPVAASIEGGVLHGLLPMVPLGIADGMNLAFTVHDAQISAAIGPDGLTNGVIGGSLLENELVDELERVSPGSSAMTRPIIRMSADLQPTADPLICDAMSIGVGFTAVPAMSVAPL